MSHFSTLAAILRVHTVHRITYDPGPRRRQDQGSQYGSDDWIRFCKAHELDPSMSRRGSCWDFAVVESFFGSLKKERIRKHVYPTRELAKADIFEYIEMFYNRTRRHSHLVGVSPETFEAASNVGL
jgi:putative transposase